MGNVCEDGIMVFEDQPTTLWTEYNQANAWTSLNQFPQNSTVDLSAEFKITIELDSVPIIGVGGAKQYVLYKSNGNQDLKLFFSNQPETDNLDKLCFQKESSDLRCVNPAKNITISRYHEIETTLSS
jgi:hypothetical protein